MDFWKTCELSALCLIQLMDKMFIHESKLFLPEVKPIPKEALSASLDKHKYLTHICKCLIQTLIFQKTSKTRNNCQCRSLSIRLWLSIEVLFLIKKQNKIMHTVISKLKPSKQTSRPDKNCNFLKCFHVNRLFKVLVLQIFFLLSRILLANRMLSGVAFNFIWPSFPPSVFPECSHSLLQMFGTASQLDVYFFLFSFTSHEPSKS